MYNDFTDEIKKLHQEYYALADAKATEEVRTTSYKKYRAAADQYILEHHDLTLTFVDIGEHTVVCPYAFTKCCVKGSSYENAGEIYFVVTDDTIYFDPKRHF